MEDSKIILLMQNRPDKGLYEAIQKYNGLVTAVVSRILRDRQDVEECVSDAFVNVWKNIHRLQADSSSLKGYLLCTARNVALNRYKQLKRQDAVSLEDQLVEPASGEDLEHQVLAEEDGRTLLEAVQALGEPDCEIVMRRYFLFEPPGEIAQRLALDPVMVKNKLYRSKDKLKKILTERGVML